MNARGLQDVLEEISRSLQSVRRRLDDLETQVGGGGGGGAESFTALDDTPGDYSSNALSYLRVNSGESAVEYAAPDWPVIQDTPAPVTGKVAMWDSASVIGDAGFDAIDVVTVNDSHVVTLGMIQQVATQVLLGRASGGNGFVEALTALPANIEASIDHGNLAGLGDDDHTQYALLAGRSGGQTVTGGTAASQSLKLRGTSHATPGDVRVLERLSVGGDFQAIQIFKVVSDLGVASGLHELGQLSHAQTGAGNAGVGIGYVANGTSRIAGFIRPTGNLPLYITNSVGAVTMALDNTGNVGIGTSNPQARLHVAGEVSGSGFAVKSVSGIAGTAVELLPAGSVSAGCKLQPMWTIKPSSGNSRAGTHGSTSALNDLQPGGNEIDLYDAATNVVKLRVNANGSVDVRRTAGSLTYTLNIQLLWL